MVFHKITEPVNRYSRKRIVPTSKNAWARQTDPYGLVHPRNQPSEPVNQ